MNVRSQFCKNFEPSHVPAMSCTCCDCWSSLTPHDLDFVEGGDHPSWLLPSAILQFVWPREEVCGNSKPEEPSRFDACRHDNVGRGTAVSIVRNGRMFRLPQSVPQICPNRCSFGFALLTWVWWRGSGVGGARVCLCVDTW